MVLRLLFLTSAILLFASPGTAAKPKSASTFDLTKVVIFHDDFQSGLGKWKIAVNRPEDRETLDAQTIDERVRVVDAPDSVAGRKAVCCVVPRVLDQHRSEIALPHEDGFHERWYGARLYVPTDWKFNDDDGGDIVMQWHAVLGEEWVTRNFPPLSIAIKDDRWSIRQAFGRTDDIKRNFETVKEKVQRGKWTAWVIHARWSSESDGLIEIWKDGEQVLSEKGPNTYSSRPRTPYFKTGIYHPEWKEDNADEFAAAKSPVRERVIYMADIAIGGEKATYADVAPKP